MAPGPNTSKRHPDHPTYPYLLRGLDVVRPNQVWATDITYVRVERGFAYLVAILDLYFCKVLAWQLSNTLDSGFCVQTLRKALQTHGKPETFNTDQGCQFTIATFTGALNAHGIEISMDGRGRALDNIYVERLWRSVQYEDTYLKRYATIVELHQGLLEYFPFYNTERKHQALACRTPDEVYRTAMGGGAKIPDRFQEQKQCPRDEKVTHWVPQEMKHGILNSV